VLNTDYLGHKRKHAPQVRGGALERVLSNLVLLVRITVVQHAYVGGIIAQDYVGSGILHFGPNLGLALFGGDVPQKFQDIRVDEPDWNGRMSTATTRDPTWA